MNILTAIYNFFEGLNKNAIIFILGALFMLLFLKQCNQIDSLKREIASTKKEAEVHYNNLLASHDSVRYYRTENGNLIAEKRSFIYDIKEFETKYANLAKEYSKQLDLNGNLNKTNALLKAELSLQSSIQVDPALVS